MSVFAGLVGCDALRLEQALSLWSRPPEGHAFDFNYRTTGAYLASWERSHPIQDYTRSRSPRNWLIMVDGRIRDPEQHVHKLQCNNPAWVDGFLAQAIERWSDGKVQQLDGEFAIAAWHPDQEELLLCRDPVGGHPLYYHRMADGIAFATDLPLLLRMPFISRRLDSDTITARLSRVPDRSASTTYYESIELLPAGHILSYRKDKLSIRRWWQPKRILTHQAKPEQRLQQMITTAVEERMRGGQRIAVHLSGGLDSSAIACIAARRLQRDGRRLLAFSSVLPPGWSGPETDEREHIEAVLAQEQNIDVHWVEPPESDDPFTAAVEGFELLGQPRYTTVPHIEQALARLGRELGVDVVLSGFGGDFFASWRGAGVVLALLGEGKWRLAVEEFLALNRHKACSWPRLFKREIVAPLVSRLPIAGLGPGGQAAYRRKLLAYTHPHEWMRFILEPGRMEQSINSSVQYFARGFGQTLRFPLLDRDLIEFMLSVPIEQLQHNGENRSLFRRAMRGIIPESVRLRQDKGPAFDPLLAARIVAVREQLRVWAEHPNQSPCWQYVDRSRFLRELDAVRPSDRAGWKPGMFEHVLSGGMLAQFIEWQAKSTAE